MRLSIDVALDYALSAPGPAILSIEAAGALGQEILQAHIDLGPLEHFARVPGEEGIGEKIVVRAADHLTCSYRAEVEVTRPRLDFAALSDVPFDQLPGDALRYLLPSRYCPSDRFVTFADQQFGGLTGGARVAAIRDWIAGHLTYVSGSSTIDTTAIDSFIDRQGVCRDYAHLMITLCRAAQVPARIASVFAPGVTPPDFHAVTEVYLDGAWHLIDATGMAHADQMALIAVGRDALDVAFLTTMTNATMQRQSVAVSEISG